MSEVSTADRDGMRGAGGSGSASVAVLGDLKHRSASQARAAITAAVRRRLRHHALRPTVDKLNTVSGSRTVYSDHRCYFFTTHTFTYW